MKNNEQVTFCPECPNKGDCEGTITDGKPHTVDRNFFSVSDEECGTQVELGVYFYDTEGNKSDYFAPHTTLEDVAQCTGKTIDHRTGFLGLKAIKGCGAHIKNVHALRQQIYGTTEPPKK